MFTSLDEKKKTQKEERNIKKGISTPHTYPFYTATNRWC